DSRRGCGLKSYSAMESSPGNVKEIQGVEASHHRIDFLPAARVDPYHNCDCRTGPGVTGQINPERSEVRAMTSRVLSVDPYIGFAMNAAKDKPGDLSGPCRRNRHFRP